MTQQINLYGPQFRRQKRSGVTATTLPLVLGLALIGVAALYAVESRQRAQLRSELAAVEAAFKVEQTTSQQLEAERATRKKSAALEAEVGRLDQRRQALGESIDALASGELGDTRGFSEYMRAFARQSRDGLWLTGFTVSGAGNDISVSGRALSADLIPAYLQRLGQEPALSGHAFASLQIQRPKTDAAVEAAQGDGKGPARAPRYVEFKVATVIPSGAGDTGGVPAAGGAR